MERGGEAARPTTVGSTDLGLAGAVQGDEANIGSGAFDCQLGTAAAAPGSFSDFVFNGAHHSSTRFARQVRAVAGRGVGPVAAGFHFHRQPGQGVAYPNIGEFWRQLGPVDAVLVGPQLPDGVHDSYVYSALQPRPGAGRGVVLVDLLPGGGAVYNGDYALQPRPGLEHGDVLVDLLPDGAGVMYNNFMWQHSPGAGHGEVFVGLLPGGVDAVYDDYGYYAWQPRPGAGRGEVFIGPLPDGVRAVFVNSGNFAQQTLPGTGRADGIAGALRDPNLGAGYDNRGMVTEHLRRLIPFAGIGASSVAINGFAAGPGSPAVAFHLFVLLLGGLFLVILHVLRV